MKKIALLISILMVFGSASAFAETTITTQAQVDSINSLTTQIKTLQAERKSKLSELVTQLRQGTRSDAVTTLQLLLSLDSSIYPEGLVTGYFGKLTAKAVKKFQAKNGLEQVGNVGPKTVEKLKKLADDNSLTVEDDQDNNENENNGNGIGKLKRLCAIIPPGHFIAPGFLKKQGGERPEVPKCQTLPKGIKDKLKSISPLPDSNDHTAPIISNATTVEISATSAKFTWTTNESSKSKVWYGTANPLVLGTATLVENNTFVTSHSLTVNSLIPSTVYYFIVGSTDASSNASISTQGTFTTTAI